MIYRNFLGEKTSLLGFGTMRLPTLPDGKVDEELTRRMIDDAIREGVNYFDTAVPYHDGESERIVGEILARYPRDSFLLATKFPGHQVFSDYDPERVFETQLKKCGVDYFDFYLLHNVFENSIKTYTDPRWGIMDYFIEQKKKGRIRHLGFSSHGGMEVLEEFLDRYGEHMEFCQLQINYLDWTLQDAKSKYELMERRGIPVIVMEPVRGGRLCHLTPEDEAELHALRPDESIASWGFRFCAGLSNVGVVLSGMSAMEQVRDNLNTFTDDKPLSDAEISTLFEIAEGMKNSVPCTACRYCVAGCPMQIDIPKMLQIYNEVRFLPSFNATMRIEFLEKNRQPSACISCGACTKICPQKIDIPTHLHDLAKRLETLPKWKQISKEREDVMNKSYY